MFDFANLNDSVNDAPPASVENAFAWGSDEIGHVIGRNPRQTHHLLTKGEIKSAKKIGGRWVANVRALLREFGAGSGTTITSTELDLTCVMTMKSVLDAVSCPSCRRRIAKGILRDFGKMVGDLSTKGVRCDDEPAETAH